MDSLLCNGMSEVCSQLAMSMRLDIVRMESKIEIAKEHNIKGIMGLRKEIKSKEKFEKSFMKKAKVFKQLAKLNKEDEK